MGGASWLDLGSAFGIPSPPPQDEKPPVELADEAREIISDFLYIATSEFATRSSREDLGKLRVHRIVSMDSSIPHAYENSIFYLDVPIDEQQTQVTKELEAFFEYLDECRGLEHQGRILVHSNESKSRAPAFVIAYLMRLKDWTLRQAYAFVKGRWVRTRISAVIMSQLRLFELKLRGTSTWTPEWHANTSVPTNLKQTTGLESGGKSEDSQSVGVVATATTSGSGGEASPGPATSDGKARVNIVLANGETETLECYDTLHAKNLYEYVRKIGAHDKFDLTVGKDRNVLPSDASTTVSKLGLDNHTVFQIPHKKWFEKSREVVTPKWLGGKWISLQVTTEDSEKLEQVSLDRQPKRTSDALGFQGFKTHFSGQVEEGTLQMSFGTNEVLVTKDGIVKRYDFSVLDGQLEMVEIVEGGDLPYFGKKVHVLDLVVTLNKDGKKELIGSFTNEKTSSVFSKDYFKLMVKLGLCVP